MASPPPGVVTALLQRWGEGDDGALAQLLPLVYGELRALARRQLQREAPGHPLQPTALVHEAYLRLCGGAKAPVLVDRVHFYRVAALCMRRCLVEEARRRLALRRGGGATTLCLGEVDGAQGDARGDLDLLALDEALSRLAALDARQARMVELRFFGALSLEEVAGAMELSLATVKRGLASARAFLHRELHAREAP